MDLESVKKSLISTLNLNPKGILADKINREYKSNVGQDIPFSTFGYPNLLKFLEEELNGRIRIENCGWDIMLYPVGTENSGHILKLKQAEERNNRRHGHGRGHGGNHSQAHSERQQSQSTPTRTPVKDQSQASPNVSPTMPTLTRYRPFVKQNIGKKSAENNNNNVIGNTYLRDRLIESHKAFIKRNRLIQTAQQKTTLSAKSNCTPQSIDRNQRPLNHLRHSQSNETSSHSQQTNSNQPSHPSGMHARFAATLALHEKSKTSQAQNGAAGVQNEPEPTPSTSNHRESVATANKQTEQPVKITPMANALNDFEDVWGEELDNLHPPTINRSNPSSFYGVSDLSAGSVSSKSSIDPVHQRMLETSSEDEEKISEIPDLLSNFQAGDMLKARVSDTNNPLKFWIHIRQDEYTTPINDMLTKMQEFYAKNKNLEELKLKHVDDADSGYFAVEYNEQWHRVEPYDSPMGDAVRCSFIDHGTRETFNFDKLRRLDKQFWKTPKAAVCCGLGNIKPIDATFSIASANDFIDCVEDEKVLVRILHIDHSKKKAMVELTLNKNKLIVNDELVKLGHAIKKPVRANA